MTNARDITELLPFYVNGSLSADEKQRVEKELQSNADLRDDLAFFEKLRGEMQALPQENSPGELGLKRLQKSLAALQLEQDPIARAKSKIAREQNIGFWRMAAIAACLMLVIQTSMLFLPEKTELTAAGGPQMAVISATFKPQATEAQVRSLLVTLNVQIVSGPSALGVYQLTGGADVDATLKALQSHGDIVENAQRNEQ